MPHIVKETAVPEDLAAISQAMKRVDSLLCERFIQDLRGLRRLCGVYHLLLAQMQGLGGSVDIAKQRRESIQLASRFEMQAEDVLVSLMDKAAVRWDRHLLGPLKQAVAIAEGGEPPEVADGDLRRHEAADALTKFALSELQPALWSLGLASERASRDPTFNPTEVELAEKEYYELTLRVRHELKEAVRLAERCE